LIEVEGYPTYKYKPANFSSILFFKYVLFYFTHH